MGTVAKINVNDGSIAMYATFPSSGGSSVSSVDGDNSNMFVSYRECVPCTGGASVCSPRTDRFGRPVGGFEPTCTKYLAKMPGSGAGVTTRTWRVTIPDEVSVGYIRQSHDGGMLAWGSVRGTNVALAGQTLTRANAGTSLSAVMLKFSQDGLLSWYSFPGGSDSVSNGKFDLSADGTKLIAQGSFSGTKTFGSTSLTASYGPYTSYVVSLNPSNGAVLWAEQVPYCRGVQVTPDNAHVGIFSQLTGSSDTITLTDALGASTTLRSRGSYDLLAIKLDASTGAGVWALDGGGDGMEYFHGFGMDGAGNMLISGYSRSNSFHFGTHSMTNPNSQANGGDGQNKILTIQVAANSATPSCISSCANGVPVVASGHCFIDNYCYASGAYSTYHGNQCFKCDPAVSQTDWTGPDTAAHCYINGACYAGNSARPGASSRSPPSACEMCDPSRDHSSWSIRDGYRLHAGTCEATPSWPTCSFPHVDWMTADVGAGMSANWKVAGVGNFAYMGGYATGTTTLQSTASTSVRGRARVRTLRVRMHICER